MSLSIADLNVSDVVITTNVSNGRYGLYTIVSTNGGGTAIVKPAGISRARCILEACEGDSSLFVLRQVIAWGEMTPFEKDGERFTPEEIVEIVRAFPDGAVDDTKTYFEALVRAHELLVGSEEYARYFKSNNVAPLRVNRCNPHVVRRKDVRGVVEAVLNEIEHLSEMLNTKGATLTDAIALLTRKDGEALETYTSELAEELNHTDLQFVQLRDERAQASVAGFLVGDIVAVETESGAHDLQVTGWDASGAQVRNLTTNEAGKLRIKPNLDEQWHDAEGNKHDAYLLLEKADGTVEPVIEGGFAILPTRNPDKVGALHTLYEAQDDLINQFIKVIEDEKAAEVSAKLPGWTVLLNRVSTLVDNAKQSRNVLRLQDLKSGVERATRITISQATNESVAHLNGLLESLTTIAEFNEQ